MCYDMFLGILDTKMTVSENIWEMTCLDSLILDPISAL